LLFGSDSSFEFPHFYLIEMKLLKFGASTLSSSEAISEAVRIVKNCFAEDGVCFVLIASKDREQLQEKLVADNQPVELIDAVDFCSIKTPKIQSQSKIFLFSGADSDSLSAKLAEACNASIIEIWSKVDGLMTADPFNVPKAIPIRSVTYKEALELSHFGARVINPNAIQPAALAGIPIRVKNIHNPDFEGTLVSEKAGEKTSLITGITSIPDISLLRVEGAGLIGAPGTARRVFKTLHEELINVILISQASSEHSICFALPQADAEKASSALNAEFSTEIANGAIASIEPGEKMSIVAVVGEQMRQAPGLAKKVFQALGQNGINAFAIAQGSSELNLSVVISEKDEIKALRALHDSFFASKLKTINLFCVGTGQVGATLLDQIADHSEKLKQNDGLELRLVGVANSRKMAIDSSGLKQKDWKALLDSGQGISSVKDFVSEMKNLNLANSVFVDNTAHEVVSDHYEDVLSNSISVVTPNKKANSASLERFFKLQEIARAANVNFFYETNVGAGLPVIETLKDLMRSGDRVISIEAVLSGTLSYIFNSFDGSSSFSEVVIQAKENGYTEPDPRDDLSGMDVARKLLILGREMGRPLEESDVNIESLIPDCASNADSVEQFLDQLKQADKDFENKRASAAKSNEKLVYLAKVDQQSASVSLQAVAPEHPFSSLSGSDNIISFRTERYDQCPLVVKGPGAGTQVTAAGVFADIIKAASYLV